jgi:hypothetical protein
MGSIRGIRWWIWLRWSAQLALGVVNVTAIGCATLSTEADRASEDRPPSSDVSGAAEPVPSSSASVLPDTVCPQVSAACASLPHSASDGHYYREGLREERVEANDETRFPDVLERKVYPIVTLPSLQRVPLPHQVKHREEAPRLLVSSEDSHERLERLRRRLEAALEDPRSAIVGVGQIGRPSTRSLPVTSPTSSTVPAPTSPPSTTSPLQQAATVSDEYFDGWIGFDVSPRMRQGTLEHVEVSLAKEQQMVAGSFLPTNANVRVERQQISRVVAVSLAGDGFQISPSTNDRQVILDDGATSWTFDVLPIAAGKKVLTLRVDAMLTVPGHPGEVAHTERTERSIVVDVDRLYESRTFVAANWQWLAGSLALPGVGWIGATVARGSRRKRGPSSGFRKFGA